MTLVRLSNDSSLPHRYNGLSNFNSLFSNFCNDLDPYHQAHCSPSANIMEKDDEFVIEMAVPGFEKKDLKIEVENNILTVRHEQNNAQNDHDRYLRKEIELQGFSRSFRLSRWVDAEKIKASSKNGLLMIGIPKKEEAKQKPVREIKID